MAAEVMKKCGRANCDNEVAAGDGFCSARCRGYALRRNLGRPRTRPWKNCVRCGAQFVGQRPSSKYCSVKCRGEDSRGCKVIRDRHQQPVRAAYRRDAPAGEGVVRVCLKCDGRFRSRENRICPGCTAANKAFLTSHLPEAMWW